MVELEIYRLTRRALVCHARSKRKAMNVMNRAGYTKEFDRLKSEWADCQDAMVAIRHLLYGG